MTGTRNIWRGHNKPLNCPPYIDGDDTQIKMSTIKMDDSGGSTFYFQVCLCNHFPHESSFSSSSSFAVLRDSGRALEYWLSNVLPCFQAENGKEEARCGQGKKSVIAGAFTFTRLKVLSPYNKLTRLLTPLCVYEIVGQNR